MLKSSAEYPSFVESSVQVLEVVSVGNLDEGLIGRNGWQNLNLSEPAPEIKHSSTHSTIKLPPVPHLCQSGIVRNKHYVGAKVYLEPEHLRPKVRE